MHDLTRAIFCLGIAVLRHRFSQNFFVVNKDFRLVFYVMAPLISSNGHRVGTLCIMGQEPRKFDATRGAILANLSELLVRHTASPEARRLVLQHKVGRVDHMLQ